MQIRKRILFSSSSFSHITFCKWKKSREDYGDFSKIYYDTAEKKRSIKLT